MYKIFTLRPLLLALLLAVTFSTKALQLSDSSKITLLTCAPGDELYSTFGHTGIRVTDYRTGMDVVFNYGTFDFNQPGFYTNFLRGNMRYMLSVDDFDGFMQEYIDEHRRVEEQELNLTTEEKIKIFDFLFWNAQKENREYRYDFFWDNCCTRPRDIFEKNIGPSLHYNTSNFDSSLTMRQMLKPYVANKPWVDFGFDLILGLPCEVKATPRNQTFLPDKLEMLLDSATVNGQPFVTKKNVIIDLPALNKPYTGITPVFVTFLALIIGIALSIVERIKKSHFWWFDFMVFFAAGLMGTFFLCMWLFTIHYSVPKNLNDLWLIPTHLIIAFILLRKNKPAWLQYYFIATCILMVLLLIGWKWNPQPYNIAVLPLILLLADRSLKIFIWFKQKALA